MVYKLYGRVGKSRLCSQIASLNNNLVCCIDGNDVFMSTNQYIFDFRNYDFKDIANFFDEKNDNDNMIFLYSNLYYDELKDFIDFLETLNHNFMIFIQE